MNTMRLPLCASILLAFGFIAPVLFLSTSARLINGGDQGQMMKMVRPVTIEVAGSSLPDCSHACVSCTPCRLGMVSLVCSSLEGSETCPMAHKCMCNNKSYPVP
ncbi:hypothetical protein Sjap_000138 [Stephania japonica]|uniref:Epidermal patterning factor-like protein n=1 Tax=Stephania japonica TaxID=461633 RepID=A0AAP0KJ18_9MAGN